MKHEPIALWGGTSPVTLTSYPPTSSANGTKNGRNPAVLILPGGAYLMTSRHEARPVASRFAACGYHAFVLHYSCGENARMPQPIRDGFRAMAHIRAHADTWNIDVDQVFVCGFSAGGHLAACLATLWKRDDFRSEGVPALLRPTATILAYPVIDLRLPLQSMETVYAANESNMLQMVMPDFFRYAFARNGRLWVDVDRGMRESLTGSQTWTDADFEPYAVHRFVDGDTPPAFVWCTGDDALVTSDNAWLFAQAMRANGRECEFHLFAHGPHGVGLADNSCPGISDDARKRLSAWFPMAVRWLEGLHDGPQQR